MDFWSSVGNFLGTFEPKDVVTVALALVATSISIFTAGQTWRYHPKPLLVVEDVAVSGNTRTPDEWEVISGPGGSWRLVNRGNGAALNVRVRVTTPALSKPYRGSDGTLEPGESKLQKFGLSDFVMRPMEGFLREDGSPVERAAHPITFVEPVSIHAVITWTQSPRIRKVRKMRVRFE